MSAVSGNAANTASLGETLTVGKLRAAMVLLRPPPPSVSFDLYPHDLGNAAYEMQAINEVLTIHARRNRRTLFVPRNQLEIWARELRNHGADVRVEPRYVLTPDDLLPSKEQPK